MEITRRYTLETWRTSEIEIFDIPDEVFSLTFEDLMKKTLLEVNSKNLNPIELLFYCIFDQNDWRIERTRMCRTRTIAQYMAVGIELAIGVREELYGLGVPDFFLWDSNGQHRFVEVKASEHGLHENQRTWANEHNCNFYIAQLAPISPELSDEDIIEMNKMA